MKSESSLYDWLLQQTLEYNVGGLTKDQRSKLEKLPNFADYAKKVQKDFEDYLKKEK